MVMMPLVSHALLPLILLLLAPTYSSSSTQQHEQPHRAKITQLVRAQWPQMQRRIEQQQQHHHHHHIQTHIQQNDDAHVLPVHRQHEFHTGRAKLEVTSRWNGGYCANIHILNASPKYKSSGWAVSFVLAKHAKMTSSWNAVVRRHSPTALVLFSHDWNGRVPPRTAYKGAGLCVAGMPVNHPSSKNKNQSSSSSTAATGISSPLVHNMNVTFFYNHAAHQYNTYTVPQPSSSSSSVQTNVPGPPAPPPPPPPSANSSAETIGDAPPPPPTPTSPPKQHPEPTEQQPVSFDTLAAKQQQQQQLLNVIQPEDAFGNMPASSGTPLIVTWSATIMLVLMVNLVISYV